MKDQPIFDHERLDVYKVELEFVAWATILLKEVKHSADSAYREVCDQLDRGSLSALLNTAEGNGKRQSRQRAKFFDDARGSAVECAWCLDALVAKGLTQPRRIIDGKTMLWRIVSMLSKLVDRFDESSDENAGVRPRPSSSFSSSKPQVSEKG
jgi:four helix bundle protein